MFSADFESYTELSNFVSIVLIVQILCKLYYSFLFSLN